MEIRFTTQEEKLLSDLELFSSLLAGDTFFDLI
jgi:hypothetical protein